MIRYETLIQGKSNFLRLNLSIFVNSLYTMIAFCEINYHIWGGVKGHKGCNVAQVLTAIRVVITFYYRGGNRAAAYRGKPNHYQLFGGTFMAIKCLFSFSGTLGAKRTVSPAAERQTEYSYYYYYYSSLSSSSSWSSNPGNLIPMTTMLTEPSEGLAIGNMCQITE